MSRPVLPVNRQPAPLVPGHPADAPPTRLDNAGNIVHYRPVIRRESPPHIRSPR